MSSFERIVDERLLREESFRRVLTERGGLQALGVRIDPGSVAQTDAAPLDPFAAQAYGTILGGRFMAGATEEATDQVLRNMTSWRY